MTLSPELVDLLPEPCRSVESAWEPWHARIIFVPGLKVSLLLHAVEEHVDGSPLENSVGGVDECESVEFALRDQQFEDLRLLLGD